MRSNAISTRIATLYEMQAAWLEPRLAKEDITWNAFQLLAAISGAGNSASQIHVANQLGVTAASLSETVQSYVRKGWIEQRVDPSDRRVKRLTLSRVGKKKLAVIQDLLAQSETVLKTNLSGSEQSQLATLLDQMIERFPRV